MKNLSGTLRSFRPGYQPIVLSFMACALIVTLIWSNFSVRRVAAANPAFVRSRMRSHSKLPGVKQAISCDPIALGMNPKESIG